MIDRLISAIEEKENPSVVGLDPTLEMMPQFLKEDMFRKFGKTPKAVSNMFLEFNKAIIDEIYPIVPSVKPQIAMYEKYGLEGIDCYLQTVDYARKKGLIVIGDIKRGDISSTAGAYAGHIEGCDIEGIHFDLWQEDFVTVNPYLGSDGIEPFVKACEKEKRGIFVLLKTSNKSSSEIQDRLVENKPLYIHVAELINKWGKNSVGSMGFSSVGAVVGATHPKEGVELRDICPNVFFLVPGYGAQGGKAEDLKGFFDKNKRGAIVNSSRGIIAAYKKIEGAKEEDFAKYSKDAVLLMRDDLMKAFK